MLALGMTNAKHCLLDVEKILESRGANTKLQKLCSIQPRNLTEASCPDIDVDAFESTVDTERLLEACKNVDPVNDCCDQVCQNALVESARKIALNGMSTLNGAHVLPEHVTRIDDCKNIVLRWLTSKLDPPSANSILRGLSNCKLNEACPLVFPNVKNIVENCGVMHNETACCRAVESYVSQLQEQSFITNVQALNCAASLGLKLQRANVSKNVYSLCHINLKDFSLQEYGCLLPSLPSDATFDTTSGVSFICDLNDNVAAPWPTSPLRPASSCHNKTTKLPSLPKATSSQNGLDNENLMVFLLWSSSLVVLNLLF
ncbi:hypothetical protein FNV43_RR13381 [Rhamnella rubrinervis]|uniref:At1g61900-like C-terminal domain-containing protein n=1 Tax=Rhamnella rubrinervis TaxID=2594499 RepID=A0A8K0MF43_9ROSA|nr:hypothetical protein FNV43_RR13381 [Rhamnella rubrinervis]